ncbi:hypothetical protein [Natrialba magadii]|uniref:hypothetical protein n=1 Tax=Natrialba magadii TaxID=13769 RepID=UPI0030842424
MPSRSPSESASATESEQQDAEQTNSAGRESTTKEGVNESPVESAPGVAVQTENKTGAEKRKVAVICADCQTAYAAEKWPDGTTRLIGRPAGCQCGSTKFNEIDE